MKSDNLWTACGTCAKQISVSAKSCPHCGARRKRFTALKWIGGGLLALVIVAGATSEKKRQPVASDNEQSVEKVADVPASTIATRSELPESQFMFLSAVQKFEGRFRIAKNELQESALRAERRATLTKIVGSNLRIEGWTGTLTKLETDSQDKAYIAVRLAPNVGLLTWNSSLVDIHDTMIPAGTALYSSLMNMAEGDAVKVSGSFVSGDQDGLFETSLTINGAMTDPEFLFRFSRIEKQ